MKNKRPNVKTISHSIIREQIDALKRVLKAVKRGSGYDSNDGDICNEILQEVVDAYESK